MPITIRSAPPVAALSRMHAAGAPRDNFGHADPNLEEPAYRGPLEQLLA